MPDEERYGDPEIKLKVTNKIYTFGWIESPFALFAYLWLQSTCFIFASLQTTQKLDQEDRLQFQLCWITSNNEQR